MFWGSGKGSSPIVVSFDESGTITSTTGFDYSVHSSDSSYSYLYTYDEVKDNATFTYMAQ
jgi:hypothetical protein